MNEEPLLAFAQTFESDLEDLKQEVNQTKQLLDSREKSGMDRPSTHLDFVVFLEPYKEVFHELFRLCTISVVTWGADLCFCWWVLLGKNGSGCWLDRRN